VTTDMWLEYARVLLRRGAQANAQFGRELARDTIFFSEGIGGGKGSGAGRWRGGELAEGARCCLAALLLVREQGWLGREFRQEDFERTGNAICLGSCGCVDLGMGETGLEVDDREGEREGGRERERDTHTAACSGSARERENKGARLGVVRENEARTCALQGVEVGEGGGDAVGCVSRERGRRGKGSGSSERLRHVEALLMRSIPLSIPPPPLSYFTP
jgi:hypothetical protein